MDESRPRGSNKWRSIIAFQLSIDPVNSIINVLFLFFLFLVLGVLDSASSRCAGSFLEFLVPLVSVVIVVGIWCISAAACFSSESGVAADDSLAGRHGLGVGFVVAGGGLAGCASGVRSIFFAGICIRDDLVVALTDAALHIDFLTHIEEIVTSAYNDGKCNNNDKDVGKGKEFLLLYLLGIHVFDLGGRFSEVDFLALHGD